MATRPVREEERLGWFMLGIVGSAGFPRRFANARVQARSCRGRPAAAATSWLGFGNPGLRGCAVIHSRIAGSPGKGSPSIPIALGAGKRGGLTTAGGIHTL